VCINGLRQTKDNRMKSMSKTNNQHKPFARRPKRAFRARNRKEVKRILEEAFRQEFPNDTVDVSDGYKENIHVMVVSRRFDTMNERQKQEMMWEIVDGTVLTKAEKSLISLLYPVSPAEIK